jgi:integrase
LRLGRAVAVAPVKDTHALTEAELARVLAEVPDELREPVTFLADTGLRVSEMLPLTKGDVDFGRRLVRVTRRLSDGEVGAPKTKLSARGVVLSPEVARALWSRLATAPDETLLFARLDGSPLSRTRLYRVVRQAGERAGIEWPVGLHALRHSYATIMHRRGVPKERIRNALGHHSWEFTESVYVHDDSIPESGVLAGLAEADMVGNMWATRPTETGRDAEVSVGAGSP